MDVQHACICKIVLDGEILPFIEARISSDFFPINKHREVWELALDHFQQYGKPPSEDAVHKAYPTYDFATYAEPVSYCLNQLQQDRKKVILAQGVQEFARRMNEDDEGPAIGDDLESILRGAMRSALHEVSTGYDTDFFLSGGRILDRLRDRRDNPGYLRGITTGLDGLDRLTGGLQKKQLITLTGVPKAGKSSLLLYMALEARLSGHPVLLITFEMTNEEMEDRALSLLSGVDLNKILSGRFNRQEEDTIARQMRHLEELAGFVISSDITSATTVSGVQAKIQQHQPSVVYIDGTYLMDDETGNDKGTPQALTQITRGLKRVAQATDLTVVQTTQSMLYRSRGGLSMGSLGYSSSFAQDSDVLVGIEPAADGVAGLSKVKMLGARSAALGSVYISFDWGQGVIEEVDENAAQKIIVSQGASLPGNAKKIPKRKPHLQALQGGGEATPDEEGEAEGA